MGEKNEAKLDCFLLERTVVIWIVIVVHQFSEIKQNGRQSQFSDTRSLKINGSTGYAFTVCVHTSKNENHASSLLSFCST